MPNTLGKSVVLGAVLTACGSHHEAAPAKSTAELHSATLPPASPTAEPIAMSDEEILGVLRVLDDAELDLAELGRKQATSDDVRQYAAMLIQQHQSSRAHVRSVESSARLAAAGGTETARHVQQEASTAVDELRRRSGADFDRLFLETQIRAHRDVLGTIDRLLLPSARKDEVKTLVTGTRRSVEDHLAKAEELRRQLGGAAEATSHETDKSNETNTR